MRARTMVVAAAAGAAWHALPAATSLATLRRTLAPSLAGTGRPDGVAITFDDGPDPQSTPQFLAALDRLGVRATFFLLGRMVDRAPSLAAEIVAAGHEVGVHGYDHRNLLLRAPRAAAADLDRGADVVAAAAGAPVRWYRPPYGVLTGAALFAAGRRGLRPVLWSAWGRDWTQTATPESVVATVRADLAGGGTVLLHDSDCTSAPGAWQSALGALPALVELCAQRQWALRTLGEHLSQ